MPKDLALSEVIHQNFRGSANDCYNDFIVVYHRNFLNFIGQDQFLKCSSEKGHDEIIFELLLNHRDT